MELFYLNLFARWSHSTNHDFHLSQTVSTPTSISRIPFLKLQYYQQSRKLSREKIRKASEHYNQQTLRLGIRSFQFNISHNKFKAISLLSPQRLLLSSMTSSMLSSRDNLANSNSKSSPHLLLNLGRIVPLLHCSNLFSLSTFQRNNFRKQSGFSLYWILKWHHNIRRKIQIRLLTRFAGSYYRYKGWYYWRYSSRERKKYFKRSQQEKLLQGRQHFQRNYLPVYWRIWRQRTRLLMEQNRISFYLRARNALNRLRMKAQRTSRIRVLLIQKVIRDEVSQLLSALEWWKVWKRRKRGCRQLRMVNDLIQKEMKEEERHTCSWSTFERSRLIQFYFNQWRGDHEHRKLLKEWQGRLEKKVLRICWGFWRLQMTRLSSQRRVCSEEKSVVEEDLGNSSFDEFAQDHLTNTSPSSSFLQNSRSNYHEGAVSISEEDGMSPFIFSCDDAKFYSPPSHAIPQSGSPKGPKLSLHELSESIRRFPHRSQSSLKLTTRFDHHHHPSLSSPHLLTRTIDTSHALSRGYLTRYEYLQRLRSFHHQNR
jgi:hypothetical protein